MKILLIFFIFYSQIIYSASRKVFFNGLASVVFENVEIFESNTVFNNICSVLVTNISENNQCVQVGFKKQEGTQWLKAQMSHLVGSLSSEKCAENELKLKPRETAYFRSPIRILKQSPAVLAGCIGFVQARDEDSKKLGSVLATGSISMIQESKLLGGILSGAYYSSGSPSYASNNIELDFNYAEFEAIRSGDNQNLSLSMNAYCAQACGLSIPSSDCLSLCNYSGELKNTAFIAPRGSIVPRDQILTASSVWNGGSVYELTLGSYRSICSANLGFRQAGGKYREEILAIQGQDQNYPNKKRLFCAQRDGQSDLFFGSGSSTEVHINGGIPF